MNATAKVVIGLLFGSAGLSAIWPQSPVREFLWGDQKCVVADQNGARLARTSSKTTINYERTESGRNSKLYIFVVDGNEFEYFGSSTGAEFSDFDGESDNHIAVTYEEMQSRSDRMIPQMALLSMRTFAQVRAPSDVVLWGGSEAGEKAVVHVITHGRLGTWLSETQPCGA